MFYSIFPGKIWKLLTYHMLFTTNRRKVINS